MSNHFSRDRRLLRSADFAWVFAAPQKSVDACFTVLAKPQQPGPEAARLGLAIAKKQLARAVDRNRIKRLARECFRQQVPSDCGLDFVVMARSKARLKTKAELHEMLQQHFRRLISQAQTAKKAHSNPSQE